MNLLKIFDNIHHNLERSWFGALTRLGTKIGVPVAKLRVFFIYSTFATVGLFSLIYLTLVFSLWIKDIFISRRKGVFDL